jgi:thiamine-phosphate pyrophosphorylase
VYGFGDAREPGDTGLRGGLESPRPSEPDPGHAGEGRSVPIGRLHVITDTRGGRDPLATVRAALDAGAPVIQVRGKELNGQALYELACRVADLCAAAGALCVVNDRPDVAVAVDAGGVHLGTDDLPISAARQVLGSEPVVGATARDPATARAQEAAGATYLGVGPAYATTTKRDLPAPLGPEGVGAVADAVQIPVVAVAGVTVARVRELVDAGAFGVAVIGAISEAADPAQATEALLHALDEAGSR